MKKVWLFFVVALCFAHISANDILLRQTSKGNPELNKLVETENFFAKSATKNGTKSAFLEYLADDGVLFHPEAVNGKTYWNERDESAGLLLWSPIFADISTNGVLGYTTGPWNFSPKREEKNPASFGDYITIWQKQPDGNFKFVLDIGISHAKPAAISNDWKSPNDKSSSLENKPPVAASSNTFYDLATDKNLSAAYKTYAAEDIRVYREGKQPILGRENALTEAKKQKLSVSFNKKMILQSAGDLAFSNVVYKFEKNGVAVETGNTLQIWKFRDGKWQIVLDVFSPIPEKI